MILYQLRCTASHSFDAWFQNSEAFDDQQEKGLLSCPLCGASDVEKDIMAPRLKRSSKLREAAIPQTPFQHTGQSQDAKDHQGHEKARHLRKTLEALQKEVTKHFENVGGSFAEEARKIHYGESKSRPIYGSSTDEQTRALEDEGITVRRMPWLRKSDA